MSSNGCLLEAHISGTCMSYFVSAAYAAEPSRKYLFDLYGHFDMRSVVTDISEGTDIKEVIIICASPQTHEPPSIANVTHIGYMSISKSPVHKLSYQDTLLIKKNSEDPQSKILFLLTVETTTPKSTSTAKLDFTVFQAGATEYSGPRPVPLKIDNFVDSLQGFTKLADMFRRNPSVLFEKKKSKQADEKPSSFDTAVTQLDNRFNEKLALISRIIELKLLLEQY
ncbi:hypothetical protein STCU_03475 [Strigomonas culicis]|uniref:Uncharacterized protein n=1 Tax=Strigomonas culicis TaxID=28005 RepID=S9URF7_9TRYP|nr:hypothetical protein STCU_03475 [Strigomonas culicis]|eukprot:EPY31399.1 hypothetical protein STCU_03475 [Strigomonas culicis]